MTVYDNGNPVGIGQANASGVFAITTSALSEGPHTLTALTADVAGNVSGVSNGFAVTIDTTAPAPPAITSVSDDVAPVTRRRGR